MFWFSMQNQLKMLFLFVLLWLIWIDFIYILWVQNRLVPVDIEQVEKILHTRVSCWYNTIRLKLI